MNTFKKTLALTLLISACGQSMAMEPGFGNAPFGENPEVSNKSQEVLDYEAQLVERREKLHKTANPEEPARAGTPVTPDTQALLEVDQIVQDGFDSLAQGSDEAAAVVDNREAAVVLVPAEVPLPEESAEESLVLENNNVAQQNEVVQEELNEVNEQVADAFKQVANETEAAGALNSDKDMPDQRPASSSDVQTSASEAAAPKTSSTVKFYQPALDLAKEVPAYCTANYLVKDGGRDMSKDNLIAQKNKLMITFGIYAAIIAAIGGGVYGITKLFKKAPAPQEGSLADEVLVKTHESASAEQTA